jgi:hypothetical protein
VPVEHTSSRSLDKTWFASAIGLVDRASRLKRIFITRSIEIEQENVFQPMTSVQVVNGLIAMPSCFMNICRVFARNVAHSKTPSRLELPESESIDNRSGTSPFLSVFVSTGNSPMRALVVWKHSYSPKSKNCFQDVASDGL